MSKQKANLTGYIPAGKHKGCVDSYISIVTKMRNTALKRGCFPKELKLSEPSLVFMNGDELSKESYCQLRVLLH